MKMYGNSDILKMVASTAHKDELFLGLTLRAAVRSGLLDLQGVPSEEETPLLFPSVSVSWEWCLGMTTLEDPWLLVRVSWALVGCGSPAHCVHCPKRGNSGKVGALFFLPLLPRYLPTSGENSTCSLPLLPPPSWVSTFESLM